MSFACPAAWRRACPHPSLTVSFCFSSFRLVSRLVLRCPASRGRVVLARLIVIILLVGRGSWCRDCSFRLLSRRAERLFPSRRFVSFLVSGSGEALVSRFIPTVSGGAAVLVSSVSGLGRCLLVLMPSGGVGRCRSHHRRSRLFPIILWLRGMGSVRYLSFGSSSSASYSRGYCSHLVSLVRLETTGREAGRRDACLDIGVRLIMPRRLIYIMNMMYAMYIKDTRIQGYEDMMDI